MSSGFKFSQRSLDRLQGVHPKLVEVMTLALEKSQVDFVVTEGTRSLSRQKMLYDEGKSQTMNSRHLPQKDGLSHAVDVAAMVNGAVSWEWGLYEKINSAVQAAADQLGAKITWGGTWKTLRDGPHFQIGGV